MNSPRNRAALICFLLAGVTLASYSSIIGNPFIVFDDEQYITNNAHVMAGLTWANAAWAFTTGYFSNWHPLTWLSYMLDYELFGLDPGLHHWMNLLFHVANTLLLFAWLYRSTGSHWRSALVAALFALHPVHVESVAWASERKDVLCTFFGLLTLLAYTRYARKPSWSQYLVVCLCLVLGLMSKPMLVTLPCVLLLLDFWPLQRFGVKTDGGTSITLGRAMLEKLPLFCLAVASSVITVIVQNRGGSVATLDSVPLGLRLSNVLISYVRYVGKVFWPSDLAILYPLPEHWSVLAALGAAFLLMLMVGDRPAAVPQPSLRHRGVALVSRDTRAGHRPDSRRFSSHGRSVFVHPGDRPFCRCRLGDP